MTRAARFAIAALACALLAGWLTFDYTSRAEQKSGPLQAVLTTQTALERGSELSAQSQLAIREVPARFAPPDALSDPSDALGERLQAAIPAGAFITRSILSGGESAAGRYKLRGSERALTIDVVVSPAGELLSAGNRIDLFASGFGGDQRTEAVLSGAEVLDVSEGPAAGRARPTIRLASAQVPAVVRADVFAHEFRAVVRPEGVAED